jgi:hypothetical protein
LVHYRPSGTRFRFVWQRDGVHVLEGDVPTTALATPVALSMAPAYGPAVAELVKSCDAWLRDDDAPSQSLSRGYRTWPRRARPRSETGLTMQGLDAVPPTQGQRPDLNATRTESTINPVREGAQ